MASSQMVDIVLVFEESSFKIYIDLNDPAALFFTQVYLATSVWPPRQKITGFMASDGQVTIAPLQPDADFKTLNIRPGMTVHERTEGIDEREQWFVEATYTASRVRFSIVSNR